MEPMAAVNAPPASPLFPEFREVDVAGELVDVVDVVAVELVSVEPVAVELVSVALVAAAPDVELGDSAPVDVGAPVWLLVTYESLLSECTGHGHHRDRRSPYQDS